MENSKKEINKKPSQKKVAGEFGISTGFLSKILSGNRNCGFTLADKISKATGSEISIWLTGNKLNSDIRKKLLLSDVT